MKHNKRHSTNLWHRFLDHYIHDEQQQQQQQQQEQQQDHKPHTLDAEQEKILATFGPMVRSRFGAGWKRRYLVSFLQDADWNMTQALADMEDCQDANYGLLATPPTTLSCSPQTGCLLGCENDQGTSCYLDALLFAMYIGLTSFDPMLLGDPFEPALSPTPASPIAPLEQQQKGHHYRHRHHRFFSKYHRNHHRHRLLTPFRTSSPPPTPPPVPSTKSNTIRQRTLDDLHIKTNPIIITNNNSTGSTSDSNDDDSALQQKHYLQRTLRLFVNKLRKGQLVKKSNVAQVRRALSQNGWYGQDPVSHQWQQEDVSELFLFLTSIFDSPYLPFQLRLFHGANKDMDDDRIMTDRLLPLCLPPPPEDDDQQQEPIRLETMLVDQFYNSVVSGVKRKVDLDTTTATSPVILTAEPDSDQQLMATSWNSCSSMGSMDSTDKGILEIITTPINEQTSTDPMKTRLSPPPATSTPRATPQRRETEVDAWQAMELLPFYSSSNSGEDDGNLDNYPDTHLVLPLVLKRYKTNSSGNAYIKDTRSVLVPPSIPFHQFVNQNTDNAVCSKCNIKMEYVMSLKSVVAHQGTSPFSGHYVAYTKLLSPDPEQSIWLKFDDLNIQERVIYDMNEAQVLEQVSQNGYLFFYELNRLCSTCLQDSFDKMMNQKQQQQQRNETNTSDSDDSQSDKGDVDTAAVAVENDDTTKEQQQQQESSQDKSTPPEGMKDTGDDTNKKSPLETTSTMTSTSSYLDKKTSHLPQESEDWVETVASPSSDATTTTTTTTTKPVTNPTTSEKCVMM